MHVLGFGTNQDGYSWALLIRVPNDTNNRIFTNVVWSGWGIANGDNPSIYDANMGDVHVCFNHHQWVIAASVIAKHGNLCDLLDTVAEA